MTGPATDGVDVLVITRREDVHAVAIVDALAGRGVHGAIVEVDGVAGRGGLSWSSSGGGTVLDVAGRQIRPADASVTWWRRLNGAQRVPAEVDPAAHELVTRDSRASLLGLIATEFTGRYVSDPEATRAAENKLVQLRAAARVGLRVPDTLVSSDPARVREFCDAHDWRVVAKTVSGAGPRQPVMTGALTPELVQDAAVRLAPAIYQELVPGERHLRVNVFGDDVHTAMLTTTALDWRYPLDAAVEPTRLDELTTRRLHDVLEVLGLRMGVFDLKCSPDGEPVWLELNPQGQFLWLDGLAGMRLQDAFADFLVRELSAPTA